MHHVNEFRLGLTIPFVKGGDLCPGGKSRSRLPGTMPHGSPRERYDRSTTRRKAGPPHRLGKEGAMAVGSMHGRRLDAGSILHAAADRFTSIENKIDTGLMVFFKGINAFFF